MNMRFPERSLYMSSKPKKGEIKGNLIAETSTRFIVTIRITSVCWRLYLPPPETEFGPPYPAFILLRCEACDWQLFCATIIPCGIAEWLAIVFAEHWRLLGTPRPVLTQMCVYGLTLYLVKPPSWGNVSGECPSPCLFLPRNP